MGTFGAAEPNSWRATSKETVADLRLGVLQASGPEAAARRLSTYQIAHRFAPLGIDEAVAEEWALLVSSLRAAKRQASINDTRIAATAIAHTVPVVALDRDYDSMPGIVV